MIIPSWTVTHCVDVDKAITRPQAANVFYGRSLIKERLYSLHMGRQQEEMPFFGSATVCEFVDYIYGPFQIALGLQLRMQGGTDTISRIIISSANYGWAKN